MSRKICCIAKRLHIGWSRGFQTGEIPKFRLRLPEIVLLWYVLLRVTRRSYGQACESIFRRQAMDNFDEILVVDADGHVYEGNVDLASRMPEKWRSQAPIRLKDNEGNSRILLEGRLWSASQGLGPGVSGPMTDKARGYRAGMVDPDARLEDMDEEGIDVAIFFGTQIALTVNGLINKELAAVLCRAVNDWLVEYCSKNPQRLLAVGLIPCQDPPAAVKELEHLKKAGAVTAMLPT